MKFSRDKKWILCSEVVRDIALDEVQSRGPLSLYELQQAIEEVFGPCSTNVAYIASALCKENSGLAVIEGVIDTCPRGLAPMPRHVSRRVALKAKVKPINARRK